MFNLTPYERLKRCLKDTTVRPPRLEQMAKLLRENGRYVVKVTETRCTKDRKIGRLRFEGRKQYKGKRLTVTRGSGERLKVLIDHDTTDTYRTNHELARLVLDLLS